MKGFHLSSADKVELHVLESGFEDCILNSIHLIMLHLSG